MKSKQKKPIATSEIIIKQDNDLNFTNSSEVEILNKYIKEVNKIPMINEEEERNLLTKYNQNQDQEAAKIIIFSHFKLVVKIAMRYKNYGISMMDIISEGNIGLMKALQKFDLKKKVRFATYAILWIRANIQDLILKSWSSVKQGSVSLRKKLLFNHSKTEKDLLQEEQNLIPNKATRIEYSFDTEDLETGETLYDKIPSTIKTPEQIVLEQDDNLNKSELISKAYNLLNDIEKAIIYGRYIMEKKETLDVLSKRFNLSKERIRQIEEIAMKKMKNIILKN